MTMMQSVGNALPPAKRGKPTSLRAEMGPMRYQARNAPQVQNLGAMTLQPRQLKPGTHREHLPCRPGGLHVLPCTTSQAPGPGSSPRLVALPTSCAAIMASSKHKDGGGARRAAEVNEALLAVPGYADDSLFFVMRYVDKVKVSSGERSACRETRSR
jgi:hypothetical protein